jgi:hypothetical protein
MFYIDYYNLLSYRIFIATLFHKYLLSYHTWIENATTVTSIGESHVCSE